MHGRVPFGSSAERAGGFSEVMPGREGLCGTMLAMALCICSLACDKIMFMSLSTILKHKLSFSRDSMVLSDEYQHEHLHPHYHPLKIIRVICSHPHDPSIPVFLHTH